MAEFTPHLFIGIGETGAMFTLRETYLHERYIPGAGPMGGAVVNGVYQGTVEREVRDRHLVNLGQDAAQAFAKAEALAAGYGLQLVTRLSDIEDTGLRDIYRRTQDDMLRARLRAAAERAHIRDAAIMLDLCKHPIGVLAFGQYKGQTVAEVGRKDRGYLEWLVAQPARSVERFELRRLYVETWLAHHEDTGVSREHVGAIGERIRLLVTVESTRFIDPPADRWPQTGTTLVKMRDEAGHVLTTFYGGYQWNPKAGESYFLAGTVKAHNEFRGRAETLLQRVHVSED